jgi:hypothetical protein
MLLLLLLLLLDLPVPSLDGSMPALSHKHTARCFAYCSPQQPYMAQGAAKWSENLLRINR